MSTETYFQDVVDPGDRASKVAREACFLSHKYCPALVIVPHEPGNFRGPVGFIWKPWVMSELAKTQFGDDGEVESWTMLQEVENDGAGGKPQFFTLVGTGESMLDLGWEIITMTADDLARSGRFPGLMVNDLNVKYVTNDNFHLVTCLFEGYRRALEHTRMVNITGELAIMKHSITAFCDMDITQQLVMTWAGTCFGLAHQELLLDSSTIMPGMPIVGFWEPGYRCNGGTFFTNLLLYKFGPDVGGVFTSKEAMRMVRNLALPSLSYSNTVTRLCGWLPDGHIQSPLVSIAGIAHITGGGVWEKFDELLPDGVGANLDNMPEPAPVLLQAQEWSWNTPHRLPDLNAYGTLHGGCGMLVVCKTNADAERVIAEAKNDGILARVVGCTTESNEGEVKIQSRFKERRLLSSKELEED